MSATYRTVTPEEIPAAVALWNSVFGVGEAFFETLLASDGPSPHERLFVVEVDGRFVSSVHVFLRQVRGLRGKTHLIGAIGSVSTLPEYRGRGFSHRLMDMAIEKMQALGCDASWLFTGVHAHYARHGYFTLPTRVTESPLAAPSRAALRSYLVGPVAYEAAKRDLIRIHSEFSAGLPLTTVRPPEAWDSNVKFRLGGEDQEVIIAKDSRSQPVAYAVTEVDETTLEVKEWGRLGRHEFAVETIAAYLRDRFADRVDHVKIHGPRTSADLPLWSRLADRPTFTDEPWSMALPLSPELQEPDLFHLFRESRAAHWPADAF